MIRQDALQCWLPPLMVVLLISRFQGTYSQHQLVELRRDAVNSVVHLRHLCLRAHCETARKNNDRNE